MHAADPMPREATSYWGGLQASGPARDTSSGLPLFPFSLSSPFCRAEAMVAGGS